jgi:hypothetical protein
VQRREHSHDDQREGEGERVTEQDVAELQRRLEAAEAVIRQFDHCGLRGMVANHWGVAKCREFFAPLDAIAVTLPGSAAHCREQFKGQPFRVPR